MDSSNNYEYGYPYSYAELHDFNGETTDEVPTFLDYDDRADIDYYDDDEHDERDRGEREEEHAKFVVSYKNHTCSSCGIVGHFEKRCFEKLYSEGKFCRPCSAWNLKNHSDKKRNPFHSQKECRFILRFVNSYKNHTCSSCGKVGHFENRCFKKLYKKANSAVHVLCGI
jgi:hypothetical protein